LQCQKRAIVVQLKLNARRQIGRDMGKVDVLAAGVGNHEQPIVAEARHHQVIEDAACFVGQQRVALPPRLQCHHVTRHQPFERCCRVGSGQSCLTHMRHIEQRRVRAAVQVLCQHALILDGHRIPGELDHPRAERAMPRVEGNGLQRLGGGIVRQGILDHWAAPQGSCTSASCQCR
jgi:hypothetical protein